ncbi:hypothetical protein K502DRAFT_251130 [Neoconidiobolus thromboides FSU 785]|nr:hypothetical protein K502DRAFT_251130 [Neoconidiobolus thromboides FSU 785]
MKKKSKNNISPASICKKFALSIGGTIKCTSCENKIIAYEEDGLWKSEDGYVRLSKTLDSFLEEKDIDYSISTRSQMIMYCHTLVYHDEFFEDNEDCKYIRPKSKVLDLGSGRVIDPSPEHRSRTSMNFGPDPTVPEMVEQLLEELFPNKEVREYFVRYLESYLEPYNRDKMMCVWLGNGNNGNSVMTKIVEKIFGGYHAKLPLNILTKKKNESGNATPEVTLLADPHFAVIQEPNAHEMINLSTLKELTGNDSIYVRKLYSNAEDIWIKAKIIMVVNALPFIDYDDPAARSKVCCIPFQTKVLPEKKIDARKGMYVRKMNIWFADKISHLAPKLLHRIIQEYPVYRKEGLLDSEFIRTYIDGCLSKFNTFENYLKEHREMMGDLEMFNSYSSWLRYKYPMLKYKILDYEDTIYKLRAIKGSF